MIAVARPTTLSRITRKRHPFTIHILVNVPYENATVIRHVGIHQLLLPILQQQILSISQIYSVRIRELLRGAQRVCPTSTDHYRVDPTQFGSAPGTQRSWIPLRPVEAPHHSHHIIDANTCSIFPKQIGKSQHVQHFVSNDSNPRNLVSTESMYC